MSGSTGGLRTDSTPREIFRERAEAARKRGDRYVSSTGILKVPVREDFDAFAAGVAYALRTKIVYRSDGGKFARGLVRVSGDLELIHKAYLAAGAEDGATIRLKAHFFRRAAPEAKNRWVMSIRFSAPDWGFFEEDVIVADEDRVKKGRRVLMDGVIECAETIAEDIPGPSGERIRAMLAIADRLGYPANEGLWYYNRAAVVEYFSWRTGNARRADMTRSTSGTLPFDGYVYPHGEWRISPFKTMLQRYGMRDQGACDPALRRELTFIDEQIMMTYGDINRMLNQTSIGGGDLYKGAPEALLKHLNALQADRNHLYSAFK